ncbi:MAG: thioesterase family protein [Sphingobacteriales bacterium]|nr:thioesterase family protein [Sphingobacteriales bacterium]OJY84273.1 MAG: thioesterase [Sphingobacteriales bacterium 44-15]
MARIKLEMPQTFLFQTAIPVRITDINYGGHAGNDSILSIIHEARMQFLKHWGCDEKNFFGTGLIMNDVAIQFKKEVFYGDILEVSVTIQDIEKAGFDIIYKLNITKADRTETAVIAKTGMVCFDYNTKKITAVPQEAKKKGL